MKTTTKIQAFTLGEIIIVLILTSIVVGMAFSVLFLVQKQMSGIQTNYKHQMEIRKLETILNLDFNRYNKITIDEVQGQILFKSEKDSVKYQMSSSLVIKELDTFKIQIENANYFLKGEKIANGEIDAIKLEFGKEFLNQKIFVFKYNDAAISMN